MSSGLSCIKPVPVLIATTLSGPRSVRHGMGTLPANLGDDVDLFSGKHPQKQHGLLTYNAVSDRKTQDRNQLDQTAQKQACRSCAGHGVWGEATGIKTIRNETSTRRQLHPTTVWGEYATKLTLAYSSAREDRKMLPPLTTSISSGLYVDHFQGGLHKKAEARTQQESSIHTNLPLHARHSPPSTRHDTPTPLVFSCDGELRVPFAAENRPTHKQTMSFGAT